MDIKQKLQFMKDEQILGAIRLSDHREFIATVEEIKGSEVIFFDHSPNETNPVIMTAINQISAIDVPEPGCNAKEYGG